MALSIDEVLEKIGSLGLFQIRIILALSYMEWFNSGWQTMVVVFTVAEPPWHCVANSSNCTLTGSFKPGQENYGYRCNIPREQWEFDDDFTSVVTEYDLVCDRKFFASLTSSMVFAGWFIGAFIAGFVADRYGRKPYMFVTAFSLSVFGLLSAFPRVFWFYLLMRFLTGIGKGAVVLCLFVIATEYVGVRHRHVSGTSMWFSWTISLMTLSPMAYWLRDWRTLSIALGVVGLPVIFTWWVVPESARYLMLKGKVKEVEQILRKVARVNRKEYPEEPLIDPTANGSKDVRLGDIRDLFSNKHYTFKTLIGWICWITAAMVYYGVSLGSPDLGGSLYVNFVLISVVEFPGNIAAIWMMGRIGRKRTVVLTMILAAVSALGSVLLTMYDPGNDKGFYAGRIIMAMIAKFLIMITFDALYTYTAELYPTTVRNTALGSSIAIGRIGAFSAPFIVTLNRVHPLLPYGIMGILSLVAGLLYSTLPETKGRPTQEVIETVRNENGVQEEMKILVKPDQSNDVNAN